MAVSTFTSTGAKATVPAKLDKQIFGVLPGNYTLLKTAYEAYLANGRSNYAKALRRGEVSGGGRKPWRQKGTGRARFGSSRNPVWTGGGVAFGPTGNENYSINLSVNAKRQALRQALSLAADANKVYVIEKLSFKDSRTAEAATLFQKLGVSGSTLVVVPSKSDEINRATRNLSGIKLVSAKYLNVFDIINSDTIVITPESLKVISDWLGGKPKASAKGNNS